MTCHRRYTFEFHGADVASDQVAFDLDTACEEHWWFSEPLVQGQDEALVVQFQVAARDQWWAHRRAMDLISTLVWEYGYDVPLPTWETLPPHKNRGYSRVRK